MYSWLFSKIHFLFIFFSFQATEAVLQTELGRVAKQYGGGEGVDMTKFPELKWKDPELQSLELGAQKKYAFLSSSQSVLKKQKYKLSGKKWPKYVLSFSPGMNQFRLNLLPNNFLKTETIEGILYQWVSMTEM